MKYIVDSIPTLNLPDVCTNAPLHGKAFCKQHCQVLEQQKPPIPTDLRGFLEYCGTMEGNYNLEVIIVYFNFNLQFYEAYY